MSKNETILVVDDSPDNLVVMRKVLAKALPDVALLTCQHPEKAMPLLGTTDVAMALLDVQMPRIDGLELCKRIKSNPETQFVSVILITSHGAEAQMKAKGLELGADDFITRPIDNSELNARVKVALRVHRAERALRRTASEALQRFETIVCSSNDMIAMLDRNYVYLAANDAYAKPFGKTRDEIEGLSVAEFLGEAVFDAVIRPHADHCLAGEVVRYSNWFDFPITGKRFMDVKYSPYLNADGSIQGFVVNARDITERKRVEDAHRESEARLQLSMDAAAAGTWIWEIPTDSVYWDERMQRIFGYEPGAFEGSLDAWRRRIHPDDLELAEAKLREALEKGARYDFEYRLNVRESDGAWRTVHAQAVVINDEQGNRLRMAGMCVDVTERKQAEEQRIQLESQLRQSQKLESMGTLAGGVAHEINNPINGIMNYAELILDRLGPDSDIAEFATEIGHESERVATIVKNLLSFARHEKPEERSMVRLCEVVDGTLSLIRTLMRGDRITLEVDVPEDLPELTCSSQQIQQVIMNLLTNSRDALNQKYEMSDKNKKIMISAQVQDKGGQQWIRTTVEDGGSGIPEAVRERMFDPFYTTKPKDKGTGLGLSISHGIIMDHHGEMSVETEPGKWTRFHVDLPLP